MSNRYAAFFLASCVSLASTSVGTTAVAASPNDPELVEIRTELVNEPTSTEPNGHCSLCRTYMELVFDPAIPSVASFELYYSDEYGDASGEIEVEVLLCDESFATVVLPGVDLVDEEIHALELELEASSEWTWADACHAWVRFHRDA